MNEIQQKHKEDILAEHSRLNEKQKQLETIIEINLEQYKSKILCLQCGKEAEKIKCVDCIKESVNERTGYTIYISSWIVSSVGLFFITNPSPAIATGFCVGSLAYNVFNLKTFYNLRKSFTL
jgi:hypothetical protein